MLTQTIYLCVCLTPSLYPGLLWRPNFPLLGVVWWPRRLRGGCGGLPSSPSPHRPAPPGGEGDSLYSWPAATHVPGRGTHQPPPHPDISARPNEGGITQGCRRCSGFPQQPADTLLYWEEGFSREPGDWSHRECFQRHGKRPLDFIDSVLFASRIWSTMWEQLGRSGMVKPKERENTIQDTVPNFVLVSLLDMTPSLEKDKHAARINYILSTRLYPSAQCK